jgi:hypothetical protein
VGKEAAKFNADIQRTVMQSQLIESNTQIVSQNTRNESTGMGGKAEAPSEAAKPGDPSQRQSQNQKHSLRTSLQKLLHGLPATQFGVALL